MKIRENLTRVAVSATLAGAAVIASAPAYSCAASEPYIGSICATAANFCPANTHMAAAGQILAINNNTTLFSLLGTTYGGDGRTTFGIPDLRGRSAIGAGHNPGLTSVHLGQRRGWEQQQLTVAQMPQHNHTATFTAGSSAEVQASTSPATHPVVAAGDYIASNESRGGANKFVSASGAGTTVALGGVSGGGGTVTVNPNGSSNSFYTIPPQLGLTYCIAVTGIYPPRN